MQIVDDELWFRVQARIAANRRREPHPLHGRPATYLLSGLARCDLCGGPIAANTGKVGSTPTKLYPCQYHRTREEEVCACSVRRPVADMDRVVLDYLARNVLTEEVVTDALRILRQRLTDRARMASADVRELEVEARTLRTEIENLVSAVAAGGGGAKLDPLVEAIAHRQERLSGLEARVRAAKAAPEAVATELRRLEAEARSRLADFRSALAADPSEARTFLSAILAGAPRFTPEGNRFRIEGEVPAGAGLFAELPKSASPGGFEPLGRPQPFGLVA